MVRKMKEQELKDNLEAGLKAAEEAAHKNELFQTRTVNGVTLFQAKQRDEDDEEPIHHYRKNAWNEEQYNNSHELEYDAETKKPTRYQFPKGSFIQ